MRKKSYGIIGKKVINICML